MKKSILISEELHNEMRYYSIENKISLVKIAETAIEKFIDTGIDENKNPEYTINNEALEAILKKMANAQQIGLNELITNLLFEKVTEIYNQ